MHPVLVKIGSVPIHTYGLMIALGFLGGLLINRYLGKKSGIDPDKMVDGSFWGMMVGLIGARLLFVITRLSHYFEDPVGIFRVWEGGLVFWGGPLAVFLWGIWWLKRNRIDYWKFADCAIHGLVVGHILGRFGCLGAGCCYGRPTGSDWGIRLHSDLVEPHLRGVYLHPVQMYESVSLMILLAGMLWVFRRKIFDGQVLLTYLIVYPIIRSVVEVFRGDSIRGFVVGDWLSTSQFISLIVFTVSLGILVWRVRSTRAGAPAGAGSGA